MCKISSTIVLHHVYIILRQTLFCVYDERRELICTVVVSYYSCDSVFRISLQDSCELLNNFCKLSYFLSLVM